VGRCILHEISEDFDVLLALSMGIEGVSTLHCGIAKSAKTLSVGWHWSGTVSVFDPEAKIQLGNVNAALGLS
jgi:hypothetical protein